LKNISSEIKVGILVVFAVFLFSYVMFFLGAGSFFGKPGYHLYTIFPSASGIDRKAPVQISGVEVGKVESIVLVEGGAKIGLRIRPEVKIKREGKAMIKASGLLGDRLIEILPGKENQYYADSDLIPMQEATPDMENLMTRFSGIADDVKAVTTALKGMLGTENATALREILQNTEKLTASIRLFVNENKDSLGQTISNIEAFSKTLRQEGQDLINTANNVIKKIDKGEGTIGKLVNDEAAYVKLTQSLDDLKKALAGVAAITQKVEKGEGTIGKLFNDDEVYENVNTTLEGLGNTLGRIERFKTVAGFRNEHQLKTSDNKGYFTIQLQPRADKYYLFGVVDDPRGEIKKEVHDVTVGGVSTTTTVLDTKRKMKLTAQFGKRFSDVGLRIGLVENSFGLGTDTYLWDDRLKVSVDMWNFGSDDPLARSAHMKLATTYTFLNHLHVEAGYDEILNSNLRTPFIGAGLRFEDEDLKYLLGSVAGVAK